MNGVAEWAEELHPRGPGGKFASKSGAASRISKESEWKETRTLRRLSEAKSKPQSPRDASTRIDGEYDDRMRAVRPDQYVPTRASLTEAESRMKGFDVEHAAVYDVEGNMLCRLTDRKSDSVAITPELRDECRKRGDAVFTHNHPEGDYFSGEDLMLANAANLKEMRAVRPSGETIVVARPETGWPKLAANEALADDLNTAYAQANQSMRDRMGVVVTAAGGKPWEGSSAKGYSKELWNEFRFEEAHKYLTPALEKHGIRVAIVPAGHRPQA
jgi:hypothetical protein